MSEPSLAAADASVHVGNTSRMANNDPRASAVYHAWSRSFVELYTISHEWTIDNFVELDEEATVTFVVEVDKSASSHKSSTPQTSVAESREELKFKLSLKPRYGEQRDFVSLYVHNLNKMDLKYSLVFNVLSAEGERRLTRRADTRVHAPNESWGFPKFCQRSDLLDEPQRLQMLPEGSLTVLCEIGGFKRIANRSDFERVRENFSTDDQPDLSHDLEAFLLSDDKHADVKIVCDDKEFSCHKFMLASRSDVFAAMFSHKSLIEAESNRVVLNDATPVVVDQFIRFLYTDRLADKSFETVSQLLPLAEKYNVRKLRIECSQCLLEGMSVDNVAEIAIIGQLFHVELLKNKAIEFISKYPERVINTSGWQMLLKQAPDVCTAIICRLSKLGGLEAAEVQKYTQNL